MRIDAALSLFSNRKKGLIQAREPDFYFNPARACWGRDSYSPNIMFIVFSTGAIKSARFTFVAGSKRGPGRA